MLTIAFAGWRMAILFAGSLHLAATQSIIEILAIELATVNHLNLGRVSLGRSYIKKVAPFIFWVTKVRYRTFALLMV